MFPYEKDAQFEYTYKYKNFNIMVIDKNPKAIAIARLTTEYTCHYKLTNTQFTYPPST